MQFWQEAPANASREYDGMLFVYGLTSLSQGVCLGSGIGNLQELYESSIAYRQGVSHYNPPSRDNPVTEYLLKIYVLESANSEIVYRKIIERSILFLSLGF